MGRVGVGGDILNNTLFRVIFRHFLGPVGGVPVEFKGYRKHFSRFLAVSIRILLSFSPLKVTKKLSATHF